MEEGKKIEGKREDENRRRERWKTAKEEKQKQNVSMQKIEAKETGVGKSRREKKK